MANDAPFSSWDRWDAQQYLDDYFQAVGFDERFTMEFLVDVLKKRPVVPLALDFGCGPTLFASFPLALKAQEIHLSEYIEDNRRAVRKWIDEEEGAFDWRLFAREVLILEGNLAPSEEEIRERERETRRRITRLYPCDVKNPQPLGEDATRRYPLVMTHYVADAATTDKAEWIRFMDRIENLTEPGGFFIVSACGGSTHFYVGEHRYPEADIQAADLLRYFQDRRYHNIDLRVRSVPDRSSLGYESVLFICGTKPDT
jgi:phenylethanolamine N-methyltransferase